METPFGRPRMEYPTEKESIELGQDLVRWVMEESKDLRCTWSVWYTLEHGMVEKHWKALKKYNDFRPYYECARAIMARKMQSDMIDKSKANRYLGMYDRDLEAYEDHKADKDAERKKKAFEEGTKHLSDYPAWLSEKPKK